MRRHELATILFLAVAPTPACGGSDDSSHARPYLDVQPRAISFSKELGGADPPPQELTIANRGGQNLMWNVTTSEKWLTAARDPAVGATSGVESAGKASSPVLTVSVDLSGLRPGVYKASISVTSNGGWASVPVSLTILGGPPRLRVEPRSLSFSGVQGGNNPPVQTLTIFNDGGRHMPWEATTTSKWLTVSRANGTSGVEGPEAKSTPPLDVRVNLTGLAPGSYQAEIRVRANEATARIPVSLNVRK